MKHFFVIEPEVDEDLKFQNDLEQFKHDLNQFKLELQEVEANPPPMDEELKQLWKDLKQFKTDLDKFKNDLRAEEQLKAGQTREHLRRHRHRFLNKQRARAQARAKGKGKGKAQMPADDTYTHTHSTTHHPIPISRWSWWAPKPNGSKEAQTHPSAHWGLEALGGARRLHQIQPCHQGLSGSLQEMHWTFLQGRSQIGLWSHWLCYGLAGFSDLQSQASCLEEDGPEPSTGL